MMHSGNGHGEPDLQDVERLLVNAAAFEPDEPTPEWLVVTALQRRRQRDAAGLRGSRLLLGFSTGLAALSFWLGQPIAQPSLPGVGPAAPTASPAATVAGGPAAGSSGPTREIPVAAPPPVAVPQTPAPALVPRAARLAGETDVPPPRAVWRTELAEPAAGGWREPALLVERNEQLGGWVVTEGVLEASAGRDACAPVEDVVLVEPTEAVASGSGIGREQSEGPGGEAGRPVGQKDQE